MKPDTKLWLKCESVGRPADTVTISCTTREAIMKIAEWLMQVYMGQKIRIMLARSEEELVESRRSSSVSEMLADLDSLIPHETEDSNADA